MPEILSLLKENKLPFSDIEPGKIDFIVAIDAANKIIGCIGVEPFDTEGLLRSFAVSPACRNHQIGGELFNRLLSHAAQSGIQSLHLLTTTAEEYFKRRGFMTTERTQAPGAISTTSEFSSLCPSSSAYMMADLRKKALGYYRDTQRSYTDQQSGSAYWSIQGANLQLTSFEIPPHTEFEKHCHAAEQITYVLEGELFFEAGSVVHRLCKGDSIVILANTEHRVWTGAVAARALDAWSPINQKYSTKQ